MEQADSHESEQCFFVLQDIYWTPLHEAAFVGNVEFVSELLDSGANLDAKDKVRIFLF